MLKDGEIAPAAYDFIYAFSIFTHLRQDAFENDLRVLLGGVKPSGKLYITVRHDDYMQQAKARPADLRDAPAGGLLVPADRQQRLLRHRRRRAGLSRGAPAARVARLSAARSIAASISTRSARRDGRARRLRRDRHAPTDVGPAGLRDHRREQGRDDLGRPLSRAEPRRRLRLGQGADVLLEPGRPGQRPAGEGLAHPAVCHGDPAGIRRAVPLRTGRRPGSSARRRPPTWRCPRFPPG